MKYLICSDIHGSGYYAEQIKNAFTAEKADYLVCLGDVYNHGPRNPLPKDYAPLNVAKEFNSVADKLIVIKGNCDSVVDTYISDFDFNDSLVIESGNKTFFLSHGHIYNKDDKPKTKYNGVIYGHFHTAFIVEEKGVVFANPGSVSLPKDEFRGYLILENGNLTLKKL